MRSRLLDGLTLPGLAALLESLWLGTAVALVLKIPLPAALGLALAIVAAGAAVAVLARLGVFGVGVLRLALSVAVLTITAVLVAAGRPASWHTAALFTMGELPAVALALWLGLRIGRLTIRPDDALKRVARVLTFVFLIVLLARAQHASFPHAGLVVAVVMVVGAFFVALARLDDVLAVVDRRHGLSSWSWFGGVMTVTAVVLVVAGLLAAVTHGGPLLWALSAGGHLVRVALDVVAFVLGWTGYGILRAFVWLADLVHLPKPHGFQPHQTPQLHTAPLPKFQSKTEGRLTFVRDLLWLSAVVLGLGATLLVLSRTLRRFREGNPEEITEERESLLSGFDLARTLRSRLAHLVPHRRRHRRAASPREAVRYEFATLEASLADLGNPRPTGMTARTYLLGAPANATAGAEAEASAGVWASAMALAIALAHTYELARYSLHPLTWEDVERFRDGSLRYREALATASGSRD
jgi:hypothetical protein